jgi:hypothetical protein
VLDEPPLESRWWSGHEHVHRLRFGQSGAAMCSEGVKHTGYDESSS